MWKPIKIKIKFIDYRLLLIMVRLDKISQFDWLIRITSKAIVARIGPQIQ